MTTRAMLQIPYPLVRLESSWFKDSKTVPLDFKDQVEAENEPVENKVQY
jgi:hypothetical protein